MLYEVITIHIRIKRANIAAGRVDEISFISHLDGSKNWATVLEELGDNKYKIYVAMSEI